MRGDRRPLQNRVTPFGDVVAMSQRGLYIGNRGIIHDPATKTLLGRRWTTKAWLVCVLDYKGRHREVMVGRSWTELFFLDEAVALAAGHRPCFFCRRADGEAFRAAWGKARGGASGAGDGCGTAPRAAGPRPQTNPSHTWSCRRAAGRCGDCRGWRGLHHRARPRVLLERARLPGGATNPSRRGAAD